MTRCMNSGRLQTQSQSEDGGVGGRREVKEESSGPKAEPLPEVSHTGLGTRVLLDEPHSLANTFGSSVFFLIVHSLVILIFYEPTQPRCLLSSILDLNAIFGSCSLQDCWCPKRRANTSLCLCS
jgi:hypothetical protein